MNCGSDLVFAGGLLYRYTGDIGALTWAKRLAEQYVKARDPRTQLGAYQFSQAKQEKTPPAETTEWGGATAQTGSVYGDRARRQLGPEFGNRALEGRVLTPGLASTIYGRATIAQLRLAERLGKDGSECLGWGHSGLAAYARHAYDPETNLRTAMFTDGTKITPEDVKRPGYYRPEVFRPQPAGLILFLSYSLGYRLTGDDLLWQTARGIARGNGLGDLGAKPGAGAEVHAQTDCADPLALFGLLEILRLVPDPRYLALARRIGDNILATRFHHGFFLPSADHVNANFDALEPLALLALEAHLRGTPELVPAYDGGRGYIHGPHDGLGRTYDEQAIWSKTRASATAGKMMDGR